LHEITGLRAKTFEDEIGGGILADEMGMGKTFSMLALITRTLEDADNWSRDSTVYLTTGISSSKPLSRATLIVVPAFRKTCTWPVNGDMMLILCIVLDHWNFEIERSA